MTSDRDGLLRALHDAPLDQAVWAMLADCLLEGGEDVGDIVGHAFRVLRSNWDDLTKLAHVRLHLKTVRMALGLEEEEEKPEVSVVRLELRPVDLEGPWEAINQGIVLAVLQSIQRLQNDRRYGPYRVEYPAAVRGRIHSDYATYSNYTLRERLLQIPGVVAVEPEDPKATATPRMTTTG